MNGFTQGMIVAAGIACPQCSVTAHEILRAAGIQHGDQLEGADAHDIRIFVDHNMAMPGLKEALKRAEAQQ
ncbi:hypothetical protein [Halomonas sp. C22]|uniref:hypothetical protein n=1 Tax=Halomonas sp. C22 TaxID=2580567 RepID=UPI0011A31061|nr:hypothetical protein [Halomonas sp. C22]